MALVNGNYAKLKDSYLFSDIAARVAAFTKAHPEKKLIKMGIGDVTLPLAPVVVGCDDQGCPGNGQERNLPGLWP